MGGVQSGIVWRSRAYRARGVGLGFQPIHLGILGRGANNCSGLSVSGQ